MVYARAAANACSETTPTSAKVGHYAPSLCPTLGGDSAVLVRSMSRSFTLFRAYFQCGGRIMPTTRGQKAEILGSTVAGRKSSLVGTTKNCCTTKNDFGVPKLRLCSLTAQVSATLAKGCNLSLSSSSLKMSLICHVCGQHARTHTHLHQCRLKYPTWTKMYPPAHNNTQYLYTPRTTQRGLFR
jgi:hypothetical protein